MGDNYELCDRFGNLLVDDDDVSSQGPCVNFPSFPAEKYYGKLPQKQKQQKQKNIHCNLFLL
eukprot:m.57532 g.57532  ORF g.57532 m.57532 type:complete len:62 (-) comp7830_c2_seq2:1576-1761(-)